ncbi:sugar phosphate nucleotidyltransferase [Micromonospora tarapacensis]|uniref:sugar phosphate nucleotidyltransferase n=1 Tax=Micromonospora tarapacensis TaxID=2835305 RepID=UPI0022B1F566|nr:sugar phosphate nucleotidyltransferase [Micromonospora tarapacensis]
MIAVDFIGDDDFFLVTGDDLLLRGDGGSDLADLVSRRAVTGNSAAMAAAVVDGSQARLYGVVSTREGGAGTRLYAGMVEKPQDWREPVALVNISRYLLPGAIAPYFRALRPDQETGEFQTTDVINAYVADHDVLVSPVSGDYYDCGNVSGWLAANNAVARLTGITS